MRNWFLLVVLGVLLSGCSNNDDAVPASPVPRFNAELAIEKVWSSRIGRGVGKSYLSLKPAVTERWLYAVSAEGILLKLDRATGKPEWKVDLDRDISGGVSAGFGVIALGSSNGDILLLDDSNGKLLWEKPLGGQILAVPALSEKRVIVQTMDGRLHGLSRKDGKSIWLYDTVIPILTLRGESSPVVNNNITLAGFANGKLVALDTKNGYVGWERPVGESQGRSDLERLTDLDGRFWVSGKLVYAVTYQGNLAAIDLRTGREIWRRTLSSYAGVSEFLDQVYVVDADSVLYAMNADNGADLWMQNQLQGRRLSAPTAYDRYVVVGDYEGYVYWLDRSDGAFQVRIHVGSRMYEQSPGKAQSLRSVKDPAVGVRVEPVVYDDVVYIQDNSGELAAYKVAVKE